VAIEQKWQRYWADVCEAHVGPKLLQQGKPKFYALAMFPYPSGKLHMGHVRVYSISDAVARYQRMRGYDVLHPMGWDAFGLPAENAALQRGTQPAKWTKENIAEMKQQLLSLGISFDWDQELSTCDPSYYRWTQSLFLRLHRAGLAYQTEAAVNWDPVDETVLANEQVDAQGRSWRSGALVEQRKMRQWFFRITDFAEPLLKDLERLRWPDSVKVMQRNWIGRAPGTLLRFSLQLQPSSVGGAAVSPADNAVEVFTSRAETIYGTTFIALAPDHPLLQKIVSPAQRAELQALQDAVRKGSVAEEKRTVHGGPGRSLRLEGVAALHPFLKTPLPIFAADYVLADYGTGAVMGVPAHDERDAAFAAAHQLPVKVVLEEGDAATQAAAGVRLVNSGPISGMLATEARDRVAALAEGGGFGKPHVQYRLRDWLVSRQRYWGTPIPIVHCSGCGAVPVPEEELPVLLPTDVLLTRKGSPLAAHEAFVNCKCPKCGGNAKRETDTMDTFVCSSWYYARYPDAHNTKHMISPTARPWLPVDLYVGGIEHAVLHLLYARFVCKVLKQQGALDCDEPFQALLAQGMVQGRTYSHPNTGQFLTPEEVHVSGPGQAVIKADGKQAIIKWEKMSKSKRNGVDPVEVVKTWGADTCRLFVLFKAPPEMDLEWDSGAIAGPHRWLGRVHRLVRAHLEPLPLREGVPDTLMEAAIEREVKATIQLVSREIGETRQFHTAVAALMKLSNFLGALPAAAARTSQVFYQALRCLVLLLHPLAPHVSAELWAALVLNAPHGPHTSPWAGSHESDIGVQRWPEWNAADGQPLTGADAPVYAIQVAGRRRCEVKLPNTELLENEAELIRWVREQPEVKRYLKSEPSKVLIVRQRKLINFVL
jgi:leucyl-tRNA synthetase